MFLSRPIGPNRSQCGTYAVFSFCEARKRQHTLQAFCEARTRQHILQAAKMSFSDEKYEGLASSYELFRHRVLRIEVSHLQTSCSALVP